MTPIVADNKPVKVTLAKGEAYTFCTCGRGEILWIELAKSR